MSRRRNGSSRSWRQVRRWCLDRDGWRCQAPDPAGVPAEPGSWAAGLAPAEWPRTAGGLALVCGAFADHGDHVLPVVAGGSDDPSNVRACCARHNLARGARPDRLTTAPAPSRPTRWDW